MARPQTKISHVRELREAAGLTVEQASEVFGYALQTWKNKESSTGRLSNAEEMILQMMAGTHPEYRMISQDKADA